MKKILLIFCVLLLQLVVANGQSNQDEVFSLQLKKAIKKYEAALAKGDSSELAAHADALFYTGQTGRAFLLYGAADRRGVELTVEQKRNHVHAALRRGQKSPYFQRTDYFSNEMDLKASVDRMALNSEQEDLTPFYRDGKVLFSSSRYTSLNKNKFRYPLTGLPYLDIHLTDTLGEKLPLTGLPTGLQTELHDGPLYLSKDSSLLIITRTRTQPGKDGIHQLYLSYFTRKGNKWSAEQEFAFNRKGFSTQHPWLDESNNFLYYASDEPGGSGGFDIYRSKWNQGTWEEPERLGAEVNSKYDEVFPSINPDGYLVYASNHIETNGGLDLVLLKDGKRYLLPEPINSRFDDFGVSWRDTWVGYFSSNRDGKAFNDDIFSFNGYTKPEEPRFNQYLKLMFADGSGALQSTDIEVVLKSNMQVDSLRIKGWSATLNMGSFKEPLPEWGIRTQMKGYYPVNQSLKFDQINDSLIATVYITKKKPSLEAKGFLAIYFQNGEPGKMTDEEAKQLDYRKFFNGYMKGKPVYYQRSASSKSELDAFFVDVEKGMSELELFPARLDTALRSGRKMKVYMAAYTSASGSAAINKIISERRGTVLKNFIVNWNNGALQKYIDNGQLTVSDEYFPLSDPDAGKPVAKKQGPEVTMFGVPASRSRRVNVVWETLSEGRPED